MTQWKVYVNHFAVAMLIFADRFEVSDTFELVLHRDLADGSAVRVARFNTGTWDAVVRQEALPVEEEEE